MGRARKIEATNDLSAPEPRDSPDASLTDPTDSQIIDAQDVLDILESGTFPLLEEPIDDDNNEIDATDAFVPDLHHRFNATLIESLSALNQDTEGSNGMRHYQPKAARVSWGQRVLGWFRGSKQQVD